MYKAQLRFLVLFSNISFTCWSVLNLNVKLYNIHKHLYVITQQAKNANGY